MPNPSRLTVHLLPSLIPPGALRGGVAVVIDVLRATSVMVQALASGCTQIIPCLEIDDAKEVAAEFAPGSVILGGERQGLPIDGFDLGNSPGDYTLEVCGGKTLVMTTTNGTRAILSSLEADRILVASFANLGATLEVLAKELEHRPVHVVCAGTNGEVSLEDTLLAGEFLLRIAEKRQNLGHWSDVGKSLHCNDAAFLAAATAWGLAAHRSSDGASTRLDVLSKGWGGRRVTELGLSPDIREAAGPREIRLIGQLARDPIRIVAVAPI